MVHFIVHFSRNSVPFCVWLSISTSRNFQVTFPGKRIVIWWRLRFPLTSNLTSSSSSQHTGPTFTNRGRKEKAALPQSFTISSIEEEGEGQLVSALVQISEIWGFKLKLDLNSNGTRRSITSRSFESSNPILYSIRSSDVSFPFSLSGAPKSCCSFSTSIGRYIRSCKTFPFTTPHPWPKSVCPSIKPTSTPWMRKSSAKSTFPIHSSSSTSRIWRLVVGCQRMPT